MNNLFGICHTYYLKHLPSVSTKKRTVSRGIANRRFIFRLKVYAKRTCGLPEYKYSCDYIKSFCLTFEEYVIELKICFFYMQTFKIMLTDAFFFKLYPILKPASGLLQVQQSGWNIFLQGGFIGFNIACWDPVKIRYSFHSCPRTHTHTHTHTKRKMLYVTCVSNKLKGCTPAFYCYKALECVIRR